MHHVRQEVGKACSAWHLREWEDGEVLGGNTGEKVGTSLFVLRNWNYVRNL
jgi:hypothetical protein